MKKVIFNKNTPKPRFLIVGEGETEFYYFSKWKDFLRSKGVLIDFAPDLPKHSDWYHIFQKASETSHEHTYCLIDLDRIKSGEDLFKYRKKKREMEKTGITILESMPCIEYWFLLHFERTTNSITDCSHFENRLKQHIPNYAKEKAWLLKPELFNVLLPNLSIAIANAEWSVKQLDSNPNSTFTHLHLLFNFLKEEFKVPLP